MGVYFLTHFKCFRTQYTILVLVCPTSKKKKRNNVTFNISCSHSSLIRFFQLFMPRVTC